MQTARERHSTRWGLWLGLLLFASCERLLVGVASLPHQGSGGSGGDNGAGGGEGGGVSTAPVPVAAGIRRLTRAEAQASVEALLGVSAESVATSLGTDTRQAGYTRNADQRVGSVQADALWHAVEGLAHAAVAERLGQLAPCATSGGSEACARSFIQRFGGRAFRRAVSSSEEQALVNVYDAGRTQDGTYAAGIELVISAVLQAPSFLYVTELGPPSTSLAAGEISITGEEAATQLALLLTGAPASEALLSKGRSGALATGEGREAAARELLSSSEGRRQVGRFVLEWLGADAVDTSSKDGVLYPEWPSLRGDVLAESRWIIDTVLFEGDGTLKSLLLADTTYLSPPLGRYYAYDTLTATSMVSFPAERKGVLFAGAFLAANSQPASTAPVKRGAAVRKKLLCQELPVPTNLGVINVPPPDPTKTTRERFVVHSQSEACNGCHKQLDPPGFAMESFDPVGRFRTTENGKPIDASGELTNAGDAEGPFANGIELLERLANAQIVRDCLPRQVFRYAAGRSGGGEEQNFVEIVRGQPSHTQARVVELLVDWVKSSAFMTRRVVP